jgi:acetyl esterase/lipase
MRALVAWVRENARGLGGDPERLFLMGHSAGATHVATYAFDARFQPPEGHGLAGTVLVSGRYRLRADPDDPSLESIREYFGSDPAQYESRSALTHVPGSEVPALLVVAEFDQRNLVDTTGELFVALCRRDDGGVQGSCSFAITTTSRRSHQYRRRDPGVRSDFISSGCARQ